MKPVKPLLLALLFTAPLLSGAELRGKFTGLAGATVHVACGGDTKQGTIADNGGYIVRGLPSNKGCNFTLKKGDASSIPIPFQTRKAVTTYNGSLRLSGKRIIYARK